MSGQLSNVDPELQAKFQALRSTLTEKSSFCRGVLALENEAFRLMYGGRGEKKSSGFLDFVDATADDLRLLVEACKPNGKLERRDFKTAIDLKRAGMMEAVRYDLLEGNKSARPIYAELDSLEVYGAGSDGKARKDAGGAGQSNGMFGKLVIILPAPHEGGALVLRYDGNETVFDAGAVLKYAKEPSIAYVAFLSNVEHEVQPVTAGHRVALTYHLYFGDAPSQLRTPQSKEKMYRTLPPTEDTFLAAFQRLLADPTFLPEGGVLGFGLSHEYPVRKVVDDDDDDDDDMRCDNGTRFKQLENRLKGRDALVSNACRSLSIPFSIQAIYTDPYTENEILCSDVLDMDVFNEWWGTDLYEIIKERTDGSIISADYDSDSSVDFPVHWVTEKTIFNEFKQEFAKFGNSADMSYLYGKMCLIVKIGPSGKRA